MRARDLVLSIAVLATCTGAVALAGSQSGGAHLAVCGAGLCAAWALVASVMWGSP